MISALESYDRNGWTGPTGRRHSTFGYWQITAVDEPSSFSFVDGFADLDFNPDPRLPVSRNAYTFAEHDGGTRAAYTSTFESVGGASAGVRHGRGRGLRRSSQTKNQHHEKGRPCS